MFSHFKFTNFFQRYENKMILNIRIRKYIEKQLKIDLVIRDFFLLRVLNSLILSRFENKIMINIRIRKYVEN